MALPNPFQRDKPNHVRPARLSAKTLALGVFGALGAIAALANASVNALHTRMPDWALAIDGDDPVALIRRAELNLAAGGEDARDAATVLSVVQRSVRRLPINGPAFRLTSLSRVSGDDLDAMRAQMRVSDRMERRDIGAQLWLIESAVEANDVNAALRHYDTALRISEASRALLYPPLTSAMESPLIRERFGAIMASNPPWLASFLRFAISKTDNPVALAQLVRTSGGWPEGEATSSLDTELLARLVGNGDFGEAVAHFRRIDGAEASLLTSLQLTDASTDQSLAPIAWQPFQIDGIETYILASGERANTVEIEAEMETGYSGPVARTFLALEPGVYRLSAGLRADDFSSSDQARWTLECAGAEGGGESDGAPLLAQVMALAENMALDAPFIVPDDCPVQLVTVSAKTRVTTRYARLVIVSAEVQGVAAPDAL
ncbi:MAG: hypothetical protein AAFN48_04960 [Pseudomonadota bacterium]